MGYPETLDYILSKLPMFSRIGSQAIKNGLDNIITLCNALGNPEKKGTFIHVAGTNGKGSVSHMLAAILQSAGYHTGLYTSPHLKDFRERVKINGRMMEEAEVITFIDTIKPVIETIDPSFFEITVAMALNHFAKHQTDIAVIETGLGGRLDSTNLIMPQLSVITNIAYDHVPILGNTLPEIAMEKAGIIKQGVPVVVGEWQSETGPVFEKIADQNNAPLFFADKKLQVTDWKYDKEALVAEVSEKNKPDRKKYRLDLTAQYQTRNLLTVLECCRQLTHSGFAIPEEAVLKGLQHTKKLTGLHGRWELIQNHPKIILDVAHNEAGVQQLLNQLEITSYHQLHIILGMVQDKDVNRVLSMLPKNARYYFTNAQVPRALTAAMLRTKASDHHLEGAEYPHVNAAIADAKAHSHKDDLILVCGSVFLVGEVNV